MYVCMDWRVCHYTCTIPCVGPVYVHSFMYSSRLVCLPANMYSFPVSAITKKTVPLGWAGVSFIVNVQLLCVGVCVGHHICIVTVYEFIFCVRLVCLSSYIKTSKVWKNPMSFIV